MFMHRAGSVVTTLVGTHLAVSVASIARATLFGKTSGRTNDKDDSSNTTHAALLARTTESFDANHYAMLTEFVSKLYSIDNGQQKKTKSASSSSPSLLQQASSSWGAINLNGVRLAPTAGFEDPAAICVGKSEIEEAFEALTKTLHPTHVNPPICVDVQPQGDSIDVWYKLDQHYSSGSFSIKLVSLLTVTVQLEPLEDVPEESEFVVTEMKEYWHGNPFMWPQFLFYPSKRLNGIVSYQLTSRFL